MLSRARTAILALAACGHAADPTLPLDRPYSLRNPMPAVLEQRHAAVALGASPMGFAFPAPCPASPCPAADHRLAYRDSAGWIGATPSMGAEMRGGRNTVFGWDGGLRLSASSGALAAALDARIFTESREPGDVSSPDREDVDFQDEEATGSVSYLSYARYRGDAAWESPAGRFSAFRDAVHWGPGLRSNLMFHQDAVPFHGFAWRHAIGPLAVHALYGDLSIGSSQGGSAENLESRDLYAHRYELRLGEDLLLGFSDQIILYQQSRPYFFIPVFPLFMSKGTVHEESNNGSLSFDAAWRLRGFGLLYTEFLLDDLESPSSLILREYVQNKWAWMAGFHLARRLPAFDWGLVGEYARVEPYVYAHFTPGTAQAANLGHPLGHPRGPNSQTATAKAYARHPAWGYAGLEAEAAWKGTDAGSSLHDPAPTDPRTSKTFLGGEEAPDLSLALTLAREWRFASAWLEGRLADSPTFLARVAFRY